MKIKHILLSICVMLCATITFAQTPKHNCDLSSFNLSEYYSEEHADVKCKKDKNFKPSKYIASAREISFSDREGLAYLQLITRPDAKGKSQQINILIQSEYADDGQLQGSGTGGYHIDGDKLYSYIYWDKGASKTEPFGVERYTYQWDPKTSRYKITDYAFSFYGGRSWGSLLEQAPWEDTATTEPSKTTIAQAFSGYDVSETDELRDIRGHGGHPSRDINAYLATLSLEEIYQRFLWGADAKALLTETQQRIATPIHQMLLRRQIAVCDRSGDMLYCCPEMPDPMNCFQSRYTGKYTTPFGFKSTATIQQARIYMVYDPNSPDRRDTILITSPDKQGKKQYIPLRTYYPAIFGDYPEKEHVALIHLIGAYTLDKQKLTIYQYWVDGCALDKGLALASKEYQWQAHSSRFEETKLTLESIADTSHPRYQQLKINGLIASHDAIKTSVELPTNVQTLLAPLIAEGSKHNQKYCRQNGFE